MANLINSFLPDSAQEVDWLRKQQIVPTVSKVADAKAQPNYDILPPPRILHSHAVYTELFPKVIYIMRDGRDVMVSYYYHHKKFANFKGTFYEYLQSFEHRTAWHEHVNSWIYQNPSAAKMYVVRYEDLLQAPQTEVEKIVQFAGLNCTNAQIKQSIMNSTFNQLRRLEKAKGLGYVKPVNTEIPFIRKGIEGGWREEFGDKEKEFFKKMCGDILIKANYERSLHW